MRKRKRLIVRRQSSIDRYNPESCRCDSARCSAAQESHSVAKRERESETVLLLCERRTRAEQQTWWGNAACLTQKHTHTHTRTHSVLFLLPQPGCVNTTEMDIRKCRREKNPHRVKKVSRGKKWFLSQKLVENQSRRCFQLKLICAKCSTRSGESVENINKAVRLCVQM